MTQSPTCHVAERGARRNMAELSYDALVIDDGSMVDDHPLADCRVRRNDPAPAAIKLSKTNGSRSGAIVAIGWTTVAWMPPPPAPSVPNNRSRVALSPMQT